jgi:hypothetical protein
MENDGIIMENDLEIVFISSVWWFGTFFLHILGIIIPTD